MKFSQAHLTCENKLSYQSVSQNSDLLRVCQFQIRCSVHPWPNYQSVVGLRNVISAFSNFLSKILSLKLLEGHCGCDISPFLHFSVLEFCFGHGLFAFAFLFLSFLYFPGISTSYMLYSSSNIWQWVCFPLLGGIVDSTHTISICQCTQWLQGLQGTFQ